MQQKAKKGRKIVITIVVNLGLLLILFWVGKRILFPKYDDIPVTGKYQVGSDDYWVTEDKEDPFLKDGSLREVQVRVWYPKDYQEDRKLPVVVASHGSCGTIDNNYSLYRELASNGYVVLAIAHQGHAFSMVHSNGKKQSVSMDYLKGMSNMDPQTKPEHTADLFAEWMDLRMTDMAAVMDDFSGRSIENSGRYPSADMEHFITLGHSAGGASALGMARVRDDVVGVIALESPYIYDIKGVQDGEYIMDDSAYSVPILNVYSDSGYPHLREWKQYSNNVKFLEADGCKTIYYPGVGHMGLCDLSIASPVLSGIMDQIKSQVSPREQLTQLNADCMDFIRNDILTREL